MLKSTQKKVLDKVRKTIAKIQISHEDSFNISDYRTAKMQPGIPLCLALNTNNCNSKIIHQVLLVSEKFKGLGFILLWS